MQNLIKAEDDAQLVKLLGKREQIILKVSQRLDRTYTDVANALMDVVVYSNFRIKNAKRHGGRQC